MKPEWPKRGDSTGGAGPHHAVDERIRGWATGSILKTTRGRRTVPRSRPILTGPPMRRGLRETPAALPLEILTRFLKQAKKGYGPWTV